MENTRKAAVRKIIKPNKKQVLRHTIIHLKKSKEKDENEEEKKQRKLP